MCVQAPSHSHARTCLREIPLTESTPTTTGSRIMARRDPRIRPCLIVPSRYKLTRVLSCLSFSPSFLQTVSRFRFDRSLSLSLSLFLSIQLQRLEWRGKVKGRTLSQLLRRRCSSCVSTNSWLRWCSAGTQAQDVSWPTPFFFLVLPWSFLRLEEVADHRGRFIF